jgi:cation transport regulator ChaC
MTRQVFGYGSLMNCRSIEKGIGRLIALPDLPIARLNGFRRDWLLLDAVYSDFLGRSVDAAFLDVQPDVESWVDGVLLEVTDVEYARLVARERHYQEHAVTAQITLTDATSPDRPVVTFVGLPRHRTLAGAKGPAVMRRYLDVVDQGLRDLGRDFTTRFHTTTDPNPFPFVEGAYSFI